MRHTTALLAVLGLLAIGTSEVQARIIDPNIGFCTSPASASACTGQPETNQTSSGRAIGMWPSGPNNTTSAWYLFSAIPNATDTTSIAGTLTGAKFDSESERSPSFLTTGSSTAGNFASSGWPEDVDWYLGWDDDDRYCQRKPHRRHHRNPPGCDAVPEPASLLMMSSGLMLLGGVFRRRLFPFCFHVNNRPGH